MERGLDTSDTSENSQGAAAENAPPAAANPDAPPAAAAAGDGSGDDAPAAAAGVTADAAPPPAAAAAAPESAEGDAAGQAEAGPAEAAPAEASQAGATVAAAREGVAAPAAGRPRKRVLTGNVVSDKGNRTIVVSIARRKKHRLYKKYITLTKKLKAHDPANECRVGDLVRVVESRPLSREKRWRLVEIVKRAG